MSLSTGSKILFMGLGHAGKSSIKSIIFEGKKQEDVETYAATINYTRSSKNIIGSAFQIFDCGGQEAYIANFVGEQAEFIFSDVSVLVWVIDASNSDQLSTSKFYFDLAIKKLSQYSNAIVFCLIHKIDLILKHNRKEMLNLIEQYFITPDDLITHYRTTSIHDTSIYEAMGEIIRHLFKENVKASSVSETIQQFLRDNKELEGVAIYTDEGLAAFEEGTLANKLILPANLWLSSSERISDEFPSTSTLKSTVETDDYIFVFQQVREDLLFSGVAKKVAPLQYVLVKVDELAQTVKELI